MYGIIVEHYFGKGVGTHVFFNLADCLLRAANPEILTSVNVGQGFVGTVRTTEDAASAEDVPDSTVSSVYRFLVV